MKTFKTEYLKKWFNLGQEKSNELEGLSRKNIINHLYDTGIEIDSWEQWEMVHHGVNGGEFKIGSFIRLGEIPVGEDGYPERSFNFTDQSFENGVSVADDEWLNSFPGQWMLSQSDRPEITVSGIVVGHGSDGEPVIVPV